MSDYLLRHMLWLRHGCPQHALYGDDGEMQCSSCLIDFKRSSAQGIQERFHRLTLERLRQASEDDLEEQDSAPREE